MQTELLKEVHLIEDLVVRNIVEATLEKAPAYFWVCSASATGLHHPPDENVSGGTVLHVRKATKMAEDLCRAFNVTGYDKDCVLAAVILHDICKYGYPEAADHLVQGHGNLVGQVMRDAGVLVPDKPEQEAARICRLCSTHMGRWDVPYLVLPVDSKEDLLALIVHVADYVVTRAYVRLAL